MAARGDRKLYPAISKITLMILLLAVLPAAAQGAHFPLPEYNYPFADYLLATVNIDGNPAQPGDEVAFFDPQGVLCGSIVIGDTLIVHIYGNESARADDVLTVRVWKTSAGVELSGNSLILSPGVLPGVPPSAIPPVRGQEKERYALNIETTLPPHYPFPTFTPEASNYIGDVNIMGAPVPAGDEVAVFDAAGVLCGSARITTVGKYSIAVYKPSIAGTLNFRVWDRAGGMEYSGSSLVLKPGTALGESFVPAPLPPTWQDKAGYVLNIDVLSIAPGDVNGDGQVNLADVLLALRALTVQPAASSSALNQADVNGDLKIGLEELIFVLQKVAGLRQN